jgi:AcrR family transcriptional regulator
MLASSSPDTAGQAVLADLGHDYGVSGDSEGAVTDPAPSGPLDAPAEAPLEGPRRRARRGQGLNLREEILAAATNLLLEKGSEAAVSIRAIADAVGVSPPSIYLHFADKDELFNAVCRDPFQELDQYMTELAAGASDPLDEIRRRGEAYIRFGLEHRQRYRTLFMDRPPGSVTAEQVTEWSALQHMVEAVQRCMDAGLIRQSDAVLATLGLWAAVHGITSLMISMPDFPWPALDTVITQVLKGCEVGLAS